MLLAQLNTKWSNTIAFSCANLCLFLAAHFFLPAIRIQERSFLFQLPPPPLQGSMGRRRSFEHAGRQSTFFFLATTFTTSSAAPNFLGEIAVRTTYGSTHRKRRGFNKLVKIICVFTCIGRFTLYTRCSMRI